MVIQSNLGGKMSLTFNRHEDIVSHNVSPGFSLTLAASTRRIASSYIDRIINRRPNVASMKFQKLRREYELDA